jgi:hypothetical protein
MAISIFPAASSNAVTDTSNFGLIAVPAGLTLRNTYTSSTSGITGQPNLVLAVMVSGGGGGGGGGNNNQNGSGGAGGNVLIAWVPSFTSCTVGAGGTGGAAGNANAGSQGGYGGSTSVNSFPWSAPVGEPGNPSNQGGGNSQLVYTNVTAWASGSENKFFCGGGSAPGGGFTNGQAFAGKAGGLGGVSLSNGGAASGGGSGGGGGPISGSTGGASGGGNGSGIGAGGGGGTGGSVAGGNGTAGAVLVYW